MIASAPFFNACKAVAQTVKIFSRSSSQVS